jgi:hypothetical protein
MAFPWKSFGTEEGGMGKTTRGETPNIDSNLYLVFSKKGYKFI